MSKLTPEQIEENLACYRQTMETGSVAGIEYRKVDSDEWLKKLHLSMESSLVYRRKPQPKLRPWKATEVPIGALINHPDWVAPSVIASANTTHITWVGTNSVVAHNLKDLAGMVWKWPQEPDTEWRKCGVMEE